MKPQEVVKWILYVLAIIAFILQGPFGPFDHIVVAFFLLLNAMFWQHEPGGTH